jgi:hypothetical protein
MAWECEARQARLIPLARGDERLDGVLETRHFVCLRLPIDHNPFQGLLVAVVAQLQDFETGTY